MAATARYVIDIAAELDGDETASELDALTADLAQAGKGAEFFQQAVQQVSRDLQAATDATNRANDSLAAGRTHYEALRDAAGEAMAAAKGAALAQAQAAADAANASLGEGEAKYRQLEKAAANAALALERAGLKAAGSVPIETAQRAAQTAAALEEYTSTLRELEAAAETANAEVKKGGTVADEDAEAAARAAKAVTDYAATLETLQEDARAAGKSQDELAGTLGNVKRIGSHVDKTIASQAENYEKLGSALGSVGGPLGSLGQATIRPLQGFSKLSASIGSARAAAVLGVVGFAALTAAALALTAAVVVGAVKVAAWAVSLGDARREAGLAREAFEVMNPGVVALRGTVDELAKSTGVAAPELNKIAKGLLDAGVASEEMAGALKTAALAEAALGAGGADQYLALEQAATDAQKAVEDAAKKSGGVVDKELTEKLEAAQAAVGTFANRATSQLGGIVARQMQGLGAQSDRLSSNFDDLFSGLNIDSALAGMSKLVDMFDKNSVAGKALKFLFESVFQPIIDNAEDAATVVEAFYLGFLIGATKLYIAVKPAINAIAELFGFEDSSLLDMLGFATTAGKVLAYGIALVATVVGVTLVAALVAAASFFAPLIAAVYLGVKVFGFLKDAVVAAWEYLSNVSWSSVGESIVNGFVFVFYGLPNMLVGAVTSAVQSVLAYLGSIDLASIGLNIMLGMVRGVTQGVGAVVSAVKNAMSSAINAAKSVLGIASPSKVFEDEVGDQTVAGYTNAVEDGTGEAQAAVAEMVSPPPANDNGYADTFAPPIPADVQSPFDAAQKQAALSGDVSALRMQPSNGASAPGAPDAGDDAKPGAGGGSTFGPGEYNFHFHGVKDAEQAKEAFEEMLNAAIEGDTAKLGAAKAA